MKIEKINENKIRCILTRDDLEVRHMKISEIAYGSEKARSLFRDMMEQASHQFGFEADNIPLMIEAIPMPNECIILDITKVSDPEELDTRFSRFSQSSVEPGEELPIPKDFLPDGADEVIDLFQKLLEQINYFISAVRKKIFRDRQFFTRFHRRLGKTGKSCIKLFRI